MHIEKQIQIDGLLLTQEQQKLAALVYIYNHILKTVSYANVQFSSTGQVQNRFNDLSNYPSAFSTLVLRRAVCCGISDAIYLLCNILNIACEKWLTPGGGHAFNKVKLGNTWYKVDATFQIGFYPNARASEWSTSYFLTETEQTNGTLPRRYPQNQIQYVKSILENYGVNFIYETPPQIVINTMSEGIENLVGFTNHSEDVDTLLCNLYSSIHQLTDDVDVTPNSFIEKPTITINHRSDMSMSPQIDIYNRSDRNTEPHITVHNRTDILQEEKSHIVFLPSENMITIHNINYHIRILSVNQNNNYIINITSPNGTQETYLTNSQGILIEKLIRGLSFVNDFLGNHHSLPSRR